MASLEREGEKEAEKSERKENRGRGGRGSSAWQRQAVGSGAGWGPSFSAVVLWQGHGLGDATAAMCLWAFLCAFRGTRSPTDGDATASPSLFFFLGFSLSLLSSLSVDSRWFQRLVTSLSPVIRLPSPDLGLCPSASTWPGPHLRRVHHDLYIGPISLSARRLSPPPVSG